MKDTIRDVKEFGNLYIFFSFVFNMPNIYVPLGEVVHIFWIFFVNVFTNETIFSFFYLEKILIYVHSQLIKYHHKNCDNII